MAPFDNEVQFARAEDARRACHDPILDVLVKAREWLSDPTHWTKGTFNRDARGASCEHARDAASTCAWGALVYVKRAWPDAAITSVARDLLEAAIPAGFRVKLAPNYNDDPSTSHADLMSWFDRAISARRTSASE